MWSLGCILYELCALRLAFPDENFVSLIHSICRGSYQSISKCYSSKLADLIQVLLRPVAARRPSVEQLLSCSTLEKEVECYLQYVNKLRENAELGAERERLASQSSKEDETRSRVGSQGSSKDSDFRSRFGSQESADAGYGSGPFNQ